MRLTDSELEALLADDVPCGDLTTDLLGIGRTQARVGFHARSAMTLCASEEAARLLALVGAEVTRRRSSGEQLAAGELFLEARGEAGALHRAWKTAQVLVEWTSGIASAAADIVAAAGTVPVACTRKNVPGAKRMSIKAINSGGAIVHRLGLSETLLLFQQHRMFVAEDPVATVRRFHYGAPEKKLVVEVASVEEALVWGCAGADVLQLEKFTPDQVAECRREVDARCPGATLAAAGGINASNAGAYARAGADVLVTSAPYTAPPRDVAVVFAQC